MKPRIEPIEKPKSLLARIAFRFLKKQFGKVIMPAKVIYARYPQIMMGVRKMYQIEDSFKKISAEHKFLIQNFVATLNGCSFCMDISMQRAIEKKMSLDTFYDLMNYQKSTFYTEKEKAMLRFVAESTQNVLVQDDTFNTLKNYFDDFEIIEITYAAALENFLNRLVKPLGIGSDELCQITG